METHLDHIEVVSILSLPYAGEPFPGHGRINHSFGVLETAHGQPNVMRRYVLPRGPIAKRLDHCSGETGPKKGELDPNLALRGRLANVMRWKRNGRDLETRRGRSTTS